MILFQQEASFFLKPVRLGARRICLRMWPTMSPCCKEWGDDVEIGGEV